MANLSDIIRRKSDQVGGNAQLSRMLEWSESADNPGAIIGKYANGKATPSIEFAIRWKQVFGENLIDMIVENRDTEVSEPSENYGFEGHLRRIELKLDKLLEKK